MAMFVTVVGSSAASLFYAINFFRAVVIYSGSSQPTELITAPQQQLERTGQHDRTKSISKPFINDTSSALRGSRTVQFPNSSCSCCCYNFNADFQCCERTFRPSHKMGFYATLSLMRQLGYVYGTNKIDMQQGFRRIDWPNFGKPENEVDYRDVVVTRNIFEALISGYLYHKTGRECWLDPHGKPWQSEVDNLLHYENYLSGALGQLLDPPNRDRSLCEYLANETEAVGMKVYIDWAFSVYYNKVMEHHRFAHSSEERRSKALFVCFEKLTGQEDDLNELLWQAYDLFFPGGGMKIRIKPKKEQYSGGHATSQDPNLRSQLQGLIDNYDKDLFNGMIAKFQSTFKCG